MKHALIIGGTGQIGLGCGLALSEAGWQVDLLARGAPPPGPWRHKAGDRATGLDLAVGDGADLVLDCVAFDEADADALLAVAGRVDQIMAVSSASVYQDPMGRTLDEAAERGFPDLPNPISEDYRTVAPGSATYSTRKAALEERLLQVQNSVILRPCAIHGPYSKHAREWWVLKRLLDGRGAIPLCYNGESRFQTTSVAAIAQTVLWATDPGRPRIINIADADAPTSAEIARTIMDLTGRSAEIVPIPGASPAPPLGMSPWSTAGPFVCASSAPNAGTYAETVQPALDWLLNHVDRIDWQTALPQMAAYPRDHFDYTGEDAFLAGL